MSYPIFQTKHTRAHISIGTFLNFKNSLFQYINLNIETMMMDTIALPTSPTARGTYSINGQLDLVGGLAVVVGGLVVVVGGLEVGVGVGVRVRVDEEMISAKCEKTEVIISTL